MPESSSSRKKLYYICDDGLAVPLIPEKSTGRKRFSSARYLDKKAPVLLEDSAGKKTWISNRTELYDHTVEICRDYLKLAEPKKLKDADENYRVDLTDIPFVTIDGADAKDFDDAVFVKKSRNGYEVKVAIADVSAYMLNQVSLFEQASRQAFSTYLPGIAYPMLPKALTENICSLNPEEKKAAFVTTMHLDNNLDVIECELERAYIKSKHRLIYNTALEEQANLLSPARELARKLRKRRKKDGAFFFSHSQFTNSLDENLVNAEISKKKHLESEMLIEEYMLLTNFILAELAAEDNLPILYRGHIAPRKDDIKYLKGLKKQLGPKEIKLKVNSLNKWADWLDKNGMSQPFHLMVLKTLNTAKYYPDECFHFGLQEPCYSHFTSPIRRFPDLWNHIVFKRYFFDDKRYDKLLKLKHPASLSHSINRVEQQTVICENVIKKLIFYLVLERKKKEKLKATAAYDVGGNTFSFLDDLPGIISFYKDGIKPGRKIIFNSFNINELGHIIGKDWEIVKK